MDELQFHLPRTTHQPTTPSPPPPPLYTLKSSSSTSAEPVEFQDGIDFYSLNFDNSFPLQGFLSNERKFSCSSPTSTPNTSFLWNSSDVSSLLDNSSAESCSSTSAIATSASLGNSIWSPSSQVSAAIDDTANASNNGYGSNSNNAVSKNSSNSLEWDENLIKGLSKQQLLHFVELLKEKLEESVRNGNEADANQIRGAMVFVQNYIINTFVSESTESIASTPTTSITSPLLTSPIESTFDGASKFSREFVGSKDAPYTWSGQLPPRVHKNPTYSCKVFLGGLPWDITESTLMQAFKPFGIQKIEWPGKEGVSAKPKGYAYAVFENEKQVKLLLQNCTHDYNHSRAGNYYYKVSSKKFRGKDVQVIPWALSDSNHSRCQTSKIDPLKTIFVGALHGMVNAEGLATIMNDLFGGVVYAGIDTDRTKYPIGSARVTFNNTRSYMKAVTAAFVIIKTARFEKRLQVDPYLEDATCSVCNLQQGPYFCRDTACFSYFCRTCFQYKHSEGQFRHHRPMMRTTHNKPQQVQQQHVQFNHNNNNNNNNNGNPRGYNSGGGSVYNNNHHGQSSYFNGGGNPNHHPNHNHHMNHHGYSNGGGNNRQWNNGLNGHNSPQLNCVGMGGPNGSMTLNGGGGNGPPLNRQFPLRGCFGPRQ